MTELNDALARYGNLTHAEIEGVVAGPAPSKAATDRKKREATDVNDFLAHYGVKGMRWGVRRQLQKRSPSERAEYIAKKDEKWLGKVMTKPKYSKVTRMAARDAKKQIKQLNSEYKEQGVNLKKDRLARTRYNTEVKAVFEDSLDRAAYRVHGMSPSRLFELRLQTNGDGTISASLHKRSNPKLDKQMAKITKADAKREKREAKLSHAEGDEVSESDFDGLEFLLTVDDEGFVDDVLTPFDDEMEHDDLFDADEAEDILAHYGVKGMRWGVRRSDAELARAASARKSSSSSKSSSSKSSGGSSGARSAVEKAKAKISEVRTARAVKAQAKKVEEAKADAEKARQQAEAAKRMAAELKISADAEKVARTLAKEGHEMSTREIKEANDRLAAVERYNQNFSANAELKAKVEALELQAKYAEYQAKMNPTKIQRVQAYTATMADAYDNFKRIDEASGGYFSGQLKSGFGKLKAAANAPAKAPSVDTPRGLFGPKTPSTPKTPKYVPTHKKLPEPKSTVPKPKTPLFEPLVSAPSRSNNSPFSYPAYNPNYGAKPGRHKG